MSKKDKSAFVCTECGADFPRWGGQCTSCGAWNTLKEVRLGPTGSGRNRRLTGYAGNVSEVKLLSQVSLANEERVSTGISEFDRVLGGGIVRGSVVL
ncbi:MAG: DNA repair protein RadA, partial [Methylosarcina sp.]